MQEFFSPHQNKADEGIWMGPCALCNFQEIVGDEEYFSVINMNYSCVFIFEISKFVLFFL